ncbi:MAG: hypothetical protein R3E01_11125 [Pirellulaceae bacterium]
MIAFLLATLAVVAGTTLLLPALATIPAVRDRIDFLEKRHINANATFYTEQTALDFEGQVR